MSDKPMNKTFQKLFPVNLSWLLVALAMTLASCAPKLSFQVEHPARQNIHNIEYIAIGEFESIEGKISIPQQKALSFDASKDAGKSMADLLRAQLVNDLSLN